MIGMTVFKRYYDSFGEVNRIRQVKSVAHLISGNETFVQGRTVHQEGVILHPPREVEILFTPGPMKGRRPRILVDKNHLVALPPPATLKVCDRQVAPYIVSPAFGLENDVITRSIGMGTLTSRLFTCRSGAQPRHGFSRRQ